MTRSILYIITFLLVAACTPKPAIVFPGSSWKISSPIKQGIDEENKLEEIPINNGCTNIFLSAKQFARWGWLFLNEGAWEGEQLISKEWMKTAIPKIRT